LRLFLGMRVQRAEVFSAPSAGIENRGRVEKISLTFRKETSNFGNLTKWKSPFLIKLRSSTSRRFTIGRDILPREATGNA